MSQVGSEKRMLQESVKKKRQTALLEVAETRVGDAVSGSSVHFILWLIAIILCAIGRSLLARVGYAWRVPDEHRFASNRR